MIKLTPHHETIYREWKTNPSRAAHHIVVDQELVGQLDKARLENAFQRFIRDYIILQSRVIETPEGYFWDIDTGIELRINYFLQPASESELSQFVRQPFQLHAGPLLRCALIRLGTDHYRVILVWHCLVMDSAKQAYFIAALSRYYNEATYFLPLNRQQQKQRQMELCQQLHHALEDSITTCQQFWQSRIKSLPALKLGCLQSKTRHFHPVSMLRFNFKECTVKQLAQLKKQHNITPEIFCQAVLATILYRYTGQKIIPVSFYALINEAEDFIFGGHVNPVFFRIHFFTGITLSEVISQLNSEINLLKSSCFRYFPLRRAMPQSEAEYSWIKVNFNCNPPRETRLNLKNTSFLRFNHTLELNLAGHLAFEVEILDSEVVCKIKYDRDFIDQDLLINFIAAYKMLFQEMMQDALTNNGHSPITQFDMLTPSQHQQMVLWNKTRSNFPENKTLHQLFEEQVSQTPDNVAIINADIRLTYTELNVCANQVAHFFKQHCHSRPEELIILLLDKKHYTLAAILGIFKAGAACVPIDPAATDARIKTILADTQAKIIVTSLNLKNRAAELLSDFASVLLVIDETNWKTNCPAISVENPKNDVTSSNLAYVLFNQLKNGVMLEHRSVVNLVCSQTKKLQLDTHFCGLGEPVHTSHCMGLSSPDSDAQLLEYFLPLLSGNALFILGDTQKNNFRSLSEFIKNHPVEMAIIHQDYLNGHRALPVKKILVTASMHERCGVSEYIENGTQLFCLHGVPETCLCAFQNEAHIEDGAHFIGSPVANVQIYILDTCLKQVPVMVTGDLYIAGACLARGYLHQPELTQQKFIKNPFQSSREILQSRNRKLYKTDLLARWLPNGAVECFGKSRQLKLNKE